MIGGSSAVHALEPTPWREGAMPSNGKAPNPRSQAQPVIFTGRVPVTTGTSLRSLVRGNAHAGFWSRGGQSDLSIDCNHHPGGSQAAFLTGLAHLYNLIPYQRRALHAGKCGVEVEGGRVPTSDWILNLQILTSGGYRYAPEPPHH